MALNASGKITLPMAHMTVFHAFQGTMNTDLLAQSAQLEMNSLSTEFHTK